MKLWNNESEKFALMKEKLYTPVVGDILDNMGYYHQFLPQDIRPLREDMKVAGKAMTVLMIDVYGPQKKPFGFLTEALDQLEENEIYIAAGGSKRCADWGELLTATARWRKATIHDGDLIFGDVDGVLIIPKQVADEVIEKALEKAAGEKVVRKAIESGMTATAAFEKYGIL